jgi:uncharacterized protein YukE
MAGKGNIMKMEYAEADQMIQVLKEACDQLQDTVAEMENIAGALEGGAMLGDAGEAFAAGMRKQLIGSLNKLIDGLQDGSRYIAMERDDMKMAESKSAGQFK